MAESGGKDGKFWYRRILESKLDDPALSSEVHEQFAVLKPGEPQLKYQIQRLQKWGASLDIISERVKNNERAQNYRHCGNGLFYANEETAEVAEMYTMSIAYALPGSRELALAYANRSAVSFEAENYEDCLHDIERSLDNDYPEEMKGKLHARRVRCLVALKKPQTAIEKALQDTTEALLKMDKKGNGRDLVEKTLTDKNHMAPTLPTRGKHYKVKPSIVQDDSCEVLGATGVTVQYSTKYGRHIVATRDIRPAEIIAVIDIYANTRNPDDCYRECAQCTMETTFGIPCDHCVNAIYCSTSCRHKAWKDYHELECSILGILLDLELSKPIMLGIKMTLKALQEAGSVIKLQQMLKRIDSVSDPRVRGFTDNVLDCTKYASIYTLTSHAGKHLDSSYVISAISTFTVYYLATRTELFGQKYNTDLQIFDENPLLSFLGGLMIRNCEIAQVSGTGPKDYLQIAPFTALCNHSCDSNVIYCGTNKSIVFALRPITAGDQIWDTYGGLHYGSDPKEKRQKALEDHYFFTCDCVPCIANWPMVDELPSIFEIPGISHPTLTLLSSLQEDLLKKRNLGWKNGDMFAHKDELVQLLELLYEHAYPCKEKIIFRESVMKMYGFGLDPF